MKSRATGDKEEPPGGRPGAEPASTHQLWNFLTGRGSIGTGREAPLEPQEYAAAADIVLVALARRRDALAFEELARRYVPPMIHLAREMLLSNEAAWDAVQDALLDAQRALPRFRGEASFHTWLRRLVTTRCLKVLRRQRALPIKSLDEPIAGSQGLTLGDRLVDWHQDPVAALEQGYLHQALAQAVRELPPVLRAVLVLREVEDLSYEDIADVLHIPVGTVRSRLARAREFLRTRLEHWR